MITQVLSIIYRVTGTEEPTFASLGLDPNIFTKLEVFEQPSNTNQVAQEVVPQQNEPNLQVGVGPASTDGDQPIHQENSSSTEGIMKVVVAVGDVGLEGQSQVVERLLDENMEVEQL